MSAELQVVILVIAAYLVGGIPFGLLVGWAKGIDIRRKGSGNIGATNVGRVLGRRYGLAVFLLDTMKGLGPTLVSGWVLRESWAVGDGGSAALYLSWLAVGLASVFGHTFPIYLSFRGGKGVATSLGVTLGIYPELTLPGLLAFAVWGVVLGVSRYVSVASIAAALALPVLFLVVWMPREGFSLQDSWPLLAFSLLLTALVLFRHRSNVRRLWAGTETRVGSAARGEEANTVSSR